MYAAGETSISFHVVKHTSLDATTRTTIHEWICVIAFSHRDSENSSACRHVASTKTPLLLVPDSNTLHSPVSNLSGHLNSQISAGSQMEDQELAAKPRVTRASGYLNPGPRPKWKIPIYETKKSYARVENIHVLLCVKHREHKILLILNIL